MRAVVLSILCLPVLGAPPARPYDVDHYEVGIEPDFAAKRLRCQETVELLIGGDSYKVTIVDRMLWH